MYHMDGVVLVDEFEFESFDDDLKAAEETEAPAASAGGDEFYIPLSEQDAALAVMKALSSPEVCALLDRVGFNDWSHVQRSPQFDGEGGKKAPPSKDPYEVYWRPHPARKRLIVMARVSKDPANNLRSCMGQVADIADWAKENDAEIVAILIDDDRSATSGERREQYDAILTRLAEAHEHPHLDMGFDAVACKRIDRLTRYMYEMGQFLRDYANPAGIYLVAIEPPVDTRNRDGQFEAKQEALHAEREHLIRTKRIKDALAKQGKRGVVHPYGQRGYGYAQDGQTVIPEEAAHLQWAAKRILEGASLRQVVLDLNDRGARTVNGNLWQVATLRASIVRAKLARQRVMKQATKEGEPIELVVREIECRRILSDATHEALKAVLDRNSSFGPASSIRGPVPQYLGTQTFECGNCGARMSIMGKRAGSVYRCMAGAKGHNNCNVTITASLADRFATGLLLTLLSLPKVVEMMVGMAKADAGKLAAQRAEVVMLQSELDQLRQWHHARKPGYETLDKYEDIRAPKQARLDELAVIEGDALVRTPLASLLGKDPRAAWPGLSLDTKRAILNKVFTVKIHPRTAGRHVWDRVHVELTPMALDVSTKLKITTHLNEAVQKLDQGTREAQVLELRDAGLSINQIKGATGLKSRTGVINILRKAGRLMTDAERAERTAQVKAGTEQVAALHAAGKSVTEIVAETGRSRSGVNLIINRSLDVARRRPAAATVSAGICCVPE